MFGSNKCLLLLILTACLVSTSCQKISSSNQGAASDRNSDEFQKESVEANEPIAKKHADDRAGDANRPPSKANAMDSSPIDGVYVFADQDGILIRTLIMERGRLVAYTSNDNKLEGKYWYNPRNQKTKSENIDCSQPELGLLAIRYFNGAKEIETQCSVAIVDGNLWVGVLLAQTHAADASSVLHNGVAKMAEVLGLSSNRAPQRFRWREQNGSVSFFDSKEHSLTAEARKVSLLGQIDTKKPSTEIATEAKINFNTHTAPQPFGLRGKGFALALPETTTDRFQKKLGHQAREEFDFRSFVIRDSNWSPKSLTAIRSPNETDAAFAARRTDLHNRIRPIRFTQLENCAIAPWSYCLGPVGQLPAKLSEEQVVSLSGKWDKRLTVRNSTEKDKLEEEAFTFGLGRPSGEKLKALLNTIDYGPNEYGICVKDMSYSCGMGHGDHSGAIIWFPTSDSTITRYYTLPRCVTPDRVVKWEIVER